MQETASITGKRCAKFEEIKTQVQIIANKFDPEKIVLFGSYATGIPTPESDVDLLIIIDSNRSNWELTAEITLTLTHLFPLDILVKTQQEINDRLKMGDFFIEDLINNGKTLFERTG